VLSNNQPQQLIVDNTIPELNKGIDTSDDDLLEPLTEKEELELNSYLATKEEVEFRTHIWTAMNKDYIKMMAEKAEKQKLEESSGKTTKPRKKRKKSEPKKPIGPAESAAEATMEMLKRRTSTKINYTALEGLFSIDDKALNSTKPIEKEGSDSEGMATSTTTKQFSKLDEDEDDEETRMPRATYSSEPEQSDFDDHYE